MKKLVVLLVLILAISGALASTEADNLAKDFEATKKKIEDAEIKRRQVLSALYTLNKKIKKIVIDKSDLNQERAFLELNITQLTSKIEELNVRSKTQGAVLAERLRAIYKLGGPSIARFLFSSSSSSDLERNLKILGIVAKRDLELIKNYKHDLAEISKKERQLKTRLEKLQYIESLLLSQELQLVKEQELKKKLLEGIRRNKVFALNKIEDLREKSLQYNLEDAGLFDLLFKPSFADQKGHLPPPLEGLVTKRFGLIRGESQPYSLPHKGLYFSAAQGTPVRAIFSGKVTYIGLVPGYGLTLILDHGDHYYSVYSNTKEVLVKIDDEVTQSQVLASVGEAPKERISGLYFEIRHFSEPYDPQQWMKGL